MHEPCHFQFRMLYLITEAVKKDLKSVLNIFNPQIWELQVLLSGVNVVSVLDIFQSAQRNGFQRAPPIFEHRTVGAVRLLHSDRSTNLKPQQLHCGWDAKGPPRPRRGQGLLAGERISVAHWSCQNQQIGCLLYESPKVRLQ